MSCCRHCTDAEAFFSQKAAQRDLRRYRRKGANAATRHLLRMLKQEDLRDRVLLDVGGGIGAIQHELLHAGLSRAVHVDASAAYLQASEAEACRQGHLERVEYRHGDFVELSQDLPEADIVTLDRVVCCYPDMPRLIQASTSKARHLYGLSYPRARWGTRAVITAGNLFFRLRGSAFRTYMHSPEAITAEIERQGFRQVAEARTLLWQVVLYRRAWHPLSSFARADCRNDTVPDDRITDRFGVKTAPQAARGSSRGTTSSGRAGVRSAANRRARFSRRGARCAARIFSGACAARLAAARSSAISEAVIILVREYMGQRVFRVKHVHA
jgi:hypothetical protein